MTKHDEVCPSCGALNAYSWLDANMDPNTGDRFDDAKGDADDVHHIDACSGMGEWECGKCRTPFVEEGSPLNAPTWTHR